MNDDATADAWRGVIEFIAPCTLVERMCDGTTVRVNLVLEERDDTIWTSVAPETGGADAAPLREGDKFGPTVRLVFEPRGHEEPKTSHEAGGAPRERDTGPKAP